jgi:hypothetical protein
LVFSEALIKYTLCCLPSLTVRGTGSEDKLDHSDFREREVFSFYREPPFGGCFLVNEDSPPGTKEQLLASFSQRSHGNFGKDASV